jgi:hypothetical protein
MVNGVAKITRKAANLVYPGGANELLQSVARKELNERTKSIQKVNKMNDLLVQMFKQAPKGSIQKRVLQAALVKGLSSDDRVALETKHGVKIWKGQAYSDVRALISGDILSNASRTNKRFSDTGVMRAVMFITQRQNVGTLSWGVKKILIGEDEIELPKLVRRRGRKEIYEEYIKHCHATCDTSCVLNDRYAVIGTTSFYKIIGIVTSGDYKLLRAVDYVTGSLVHTTITMILIATPVWMTSILIFPIVVWHRRNCLGTAR